MRGGKGNVVIRFAVFQITEANKAEEQRTDK